MEEAKLNVSLCLRLKELDWMSLTGVFEKSFSPWIGAFKKNEMISSFSSCFFKIHFYFS